MKLTDSHAHLDATEFEPDRAEVLTNAAEAGVETILIIGCVRGDLASISTFMHLLASSDRLYGAVGVHPHDARLYNEKIGDAIEHLMEHPRIVGWGEIGLDFYYDNSPHAEQMQAFRSQLRRARRTGKPIIIHSREAAETTCELLEEEFAEGPAGVFHCFTYATETAERCLPLGFYFSFGGILTFPRADDIRETAGQIPEDRLLIETDSPYLAPVPFRGKRNEPAYVAKVAQSLAEVRGVPVEAIATTTTDNFRKLFRV